MAPGKGAPKILARTLGRTLDMIEALPPGYSYLQKAADQLVVQKDSLCNIFHFRLEPTMRDQRATNRFLVYSKALARLACEIEMELLAFVLGLRDLKQNSLHVVLDSGFICNLVLVYPFYETYLHVERNITHQLLSCKIRFRPPFRCRQHRSSLVP